MQRTRLRISPSCALHSQAAMGVKFADIEQEYQVSLPCSQPSHGRQLPYLLRSHAARASLDRNAAHTAQHAACNGGCCNRIGQRARAAVQTDSLGSARRAVHRLALQALLASTARLQARGTSIDLRRHDCREREPSFADELAVRSVCHSTLMHDPAVVCPRHAL